MLCAEITLYSATFTGMIVLLNVRIVENLCTNYYKIKNICKIEMRRIVVSPNNRILFGLTFTELDIRRKQVLTCTLRVAAG